MQAGANNSQKSSAVADVEALPLERFAGRACMVGGEPCHIGRLSMNQWLALGRFAMKVVAHLNVKDADAARAMAASIKPGDDVSWEDTLGWLQPLLNEALLAELYAVMTDLDEKFLRDTFDMMEFLEVADAIGEYNDLRQVAGAFMKAARRWSPPSQTNSDQRSESSTSTAIKSTSFDDIARSG